MVAFIIYLQAAAVRGSYLLVSSIFADDLQSGHRRRPARVESKVRDRFDGLIFGDAVLQRLSMWKGSSLMR
jgi:ABC-type long-subunit fatty acid transport system fused permease/ATPase subunit